MRIRNRNILVIILVVLVFLIYYYIYTRDIVNETNKHRNENSYVNNYLEEMKVHKGIIQRYYDKRNSWKTSNLGTILFKNINHGDFIRQKSVNKPYIVLFWKYWNWQRERHVYNFGSSKTNGEAEILKYCSVKNCIFTGEDEYLDTADAVIIHMQKKILPKVVKRNLKQRWIFLSDESPINTFSLAKESSLTWRNLSDVFNWTMTYRSNSDIPVPYGRTVPLLHPIILDLTESLVVLNQLVPYWKDKKLSNRTMVMTSNCMNTRIKFIQGLQDYIEVDVFGRCSDKLKNRNKCPGHFRADCMLPASYVFYLVLENSKCKQYITEKVFQHAFSKGAIPVIMGPSVEDCKTLLPPNSFLHVENYKNIQELAEHMTDISRSPEKILLFHAWRRHFAVANEHGYFKTRSYHLCRVCEALNYNDEKKKSYSLRDLKLFFDEKLLCDLKYRSRILY